MPVAAYIYKPNEKDYDFDEILNYLMARCIDLYDEAQVKKEVKEVYADGWVEIPQGLIALKADVKKYSAIILYSLDGLSEKDIDDLAGDTLYCVTTPWIEPCSHKTKKGIEELKAVIRAAKYYKTMNSLRIRMGIKASGKHSGSAPYGYSHGPNGLIQNPETYPTVQRILAYVETATPVIEIAEKVGMKPYKIYRIIESHKGVT